MVSGEIDWQAMGWAYPGATGSGVRLRLTTEAPWSASGYQSPLRCEYRSPPFLPGVAPAPAAEPRCPLCCRHGLPFSAADQKAFGTAGWCGWCDDAAGGYDDGPFAGEPQWLCPHGIGEQPGSDRHEH